MQKFRNQHHANALYNIGFLYSEAVVTIDLNDIVGISNVETKHLINVFPNPARNFVNLSIQNSNKDVHFAIINALGAIVGSEIIRNNVNTIDISDYSEGIYYLRITLSDSQIAFKKLFIY